MKGSPALSPAHHVVSVGLNGLVQQLHLLVVQRLVVGPGQLLPHLSVPLLPAQR